MAGYGGYVLHSNFSRQLALDRTQLLGIRFAQRSSLGWGLTVPDPVSGKDPMPLCWSSPDTLRKAIFVEWALCKRAVSDFGPFREPPEGECPWKRWGKQCAEPL